MREKLKTLPLVQLRELAKAQGLKGVTALRKAEIIDKLCEIAGEDGGSQVSVVREEGAAGTETPAGSEPAGRTKAAGRTSAGKRSAGQAEGAAPERTSAAEEPQEASQSAPAGSQDGGQRRTAGVQDDGQRIGAGSQDSGQRAAAGSQDNAPRTEAPQNDGQQPAGISERGVAAVGEPSGTHAAAEQPARPAPTRSYSQNSRSDQRPQNRYGAPNRNGSYQRSSYQGNSYQRTNNYQRNNYQGSSSYQRNTAYQGNNSHQGNTYQGNNGYQNSNYQNNNYQNNTYQSGENYQKSETAQSGSYQKTDGYQNGAAQGSEVNQPAYQREDAAPRTDGQASGETAARMESASRADSAVRTEGQADMQARAAEKAEIDMQELDSGIEANGILEVMPDGFGFIRCENFLPGDNDVYVAPSQIRRFNLKTGDIVRGSRRIKTAAEKFAALLYITTVNGYPVSVLETRPNFENLTPIFPNQRLRLEIPGARNSVAMRVMDLLSPIGKGQRGMIVSPPKAGKTTLLKQVAKAITTNYPDMHLIILLIDERPEEVTDIKEAIVAENVEVIYSTFDELPERHKRVSEMVIERAKRLVEHGRDVMILLDSITRLARAYNLVVPPSGRTLSGGLDPAALHMPKRFFGAARNMREGGSLTILATGLIETGSRMDDVVYEEFKGTGNMELVLDRKLSEKRIFPAIDILRSSTRRDDLLLTREEAEAVEIIHRATNAQKPEESVERILDLFARTRNNMEFVETTRKRRFF